MYIDRKNVFRVLLACWIVCLTCGAWAQNTMTAVGNPPYAAAKFSTGIVLANTNGANATQYATLTAPASFTLLNGGGRYFWVQSTNGSSLQVIASLTNYANLSVGGYWLGTNSSGALCASVNGINGGAIFTGGPNICDGALHYVGIQGNAANTSFNLVEDGSIVATQTGGTYTLGAGPYYWTVGALETGSGSAALMYQFGFSGTVDEAGLYSTPLYTGAFTTPTVVTANNAANLIALYHFDNSPSDSYAATTPSITAAGPTTLYASRTTTVTITGVNTHWNTSAPAVSVQNTTTTATAGAVTVVDATHLTVPVTTNGVSGSITLTLTNGTDGALVSPSLQVNALLYDLVATTDANGQPIHILVPNPNSSTPYNAANVTKCDIYFHGFGETENALDTATDKAALVAALLNAGHILGGSAAHGTGNWGNQASTDDYVQLALYIRSHYNVGNLGCVMQSMGGLNCLSCVAQNKITGIVGVLGIYPVSNLASVYTNNAYSGYATFVSSINAAYGITGTGSATFANMTAGMNPMDKEARAFRGIPFLICHSPADTVVLKSANTDLFAAKVTGSNPITVVVTQGDHGDVSNFTPVTQQVNFLNNCFANPTPTSGGISTTILRPIGGGPIHSKN